MPKILRFNKNFYFIPDSGVAIYPNGEPDEVIDADVLDGNDIIELKNNPGSKRVHDKIKNYSHHHVQ